MARFYLDQLLKGVKQAVLSTNELASKQHMTYLAQHFVRNDDGTSSPTCLKLRMPATHIQEGEELEPVHQVPTATLSAPQTVSVDELEVELDCHIKALEATKKGGQRIEVKLGGFPLGRSNAARIKITYKNGDPPEGVARINDSLLKKF